MMTKNNSEKHLIRERMQRTGENYMTARRSLGLAPLTSWSALDALIGGGLKGGNLYMICSRPGEGKTSLLNSLTVFAVKASKKVLVVSLERTRSEVIRDLVFAATGVPRSQSTYAEEENDRMVEAQRIIHNHVTILDDSLQSIVDLEVYLESHAGAYDAVFVDSVDLLVDSGTNSPVVARHVSVRADLQDFSEKYRVPVVGSFQTRRPDNRTGISLPQVVSATKNEYILMLKRTTSGEEKLLTSVHRGKKLMGELSLPFPLPSGIFVA